MKYGISEISKILPQHFQNLFLQSIFFQMFISNWLFFKESNKTLNCPVKLYKQTGVCVLIYVHIIHSHHLKNWKEISKGNFYIIHLFLQYFIFCHKIKMYILQVDGTWNGIVALLWSAMLLRNYFSVSYWVHIFDHISSLKK